MTDEYVGKGIVLNKNKEKFIEECKEKGIYDNIVPMKLVNGETIYQKIKFFDEDGNEIIIEKN